MPTLASILALPAIFAFAGAQFDVISDETSIGSPSRHHSRDLLVKRGRDCGTFTMYCGGLPAAGGGPRGAPATMACANACAYVNIYNGGSFQTTYSSSVDNNNNRIQSGCNKNAGSSQGTSVCNIAPFSQKFHDPLEKYTTSPTFQCDEFPMADMAQSNFDPRHTPRNTLRCIDSSQNAAAGAQLGTFVAGTGWYSQDQTKNGGRSNTCKGPLQDGDTYKIAFDYTGDPGFDKSTIPFCLENGNPLMPRSIWDTHNEFYLTNLGSSTGKIDFPYQAQSDNRYADALTGKDVLQCSVVVYRTGDAGFEADITYGDGSVQQESANLNSDGASFTVNPPSGNGYQSLKITRTAPLGSGDGTPVEFFYALGTANLYYAWGSNLVGADNTMDATRPNGMSSFKGRYCYWTQVNSSKRTQQITCFFPCNTP